MDIVVISSTQVRNEEKKKRVARIPGQNRPVVERRRNRIDRRRSVRDGVTVSISYQQDRRKQPDRRRTPST